MCSRCTVYSTVICMIKTKKMKNEMTRIIKSLYRLICEILIERPRSLHYIKSPGRKEKQKKLMLFCLKMSY